MTKKVRQRREYRRQANATRHQVHIERTGQPFEFRAIMPYRARAHEVCKTMSADIAWAAKWREQDPEPIEPRPYDLNLLYSLCQPKPNADAF